MIRRTHEENIAASQIKMSLFLIFIRSILNVYKHDVIERRNRKFVFGKIKKLVDSENYYLVGGLCMFLTSLFVHAAQLTTMYI